MEMPTTNKQPTAELSTTDHNHQALRAEPERGAIGIAFLVWLFGGGLGIAIVVFILLKLF